MIFEIVSFGVKDILYDDGTKKSNAASSAQDNNKFQPLHDGLYIRNQIGKDLSRTEE